jgi:hypothetical protein
MSPQVRSLCVQRYGCAELCWPTHLKEEEFGNVTLIRSHESDPLLARRSYRSAKTLLGDTVTVVGKRLTLFFFFSFKFWSR